ncbi:MAG: SLBB domain-containing protein, partial [Siphonobacter aquaeclarae]|nr:SLBB domain-containing protein [Siphonobacter aquaeclarae]
MLRIFFLLISLFFFCGYVASGQVPAKVEQMTDDQILEFIQKAESSGLTEAQIEQMALQRGYSSSDIAKMRERIAKIKSGQVKKESGLGVETETSRYQAEEVAERAAVAVVKTAKAGKSSDSLQASEKQIYGSSFFRSAVGSFEPNLRIATPKNYILGPEDELNVEIFGNSVQNYKLKVSPEGTVRLENSGPILVSGLSVDEARSKIAGRLRQLYSMPGIGIQVTLGNIRSIRVTITGEVVRPGSYSISSLATVFNAIYQSGGPNQNGTFRNIQLRRDNKVIRTIDLYDFLLNGDEKDNIGLRDQDVIVFPDYAAHIELKGEVRRPMIFEILPGESLKDVLRFAGGFTDQAYTATISVRRNTSRELKILSVDQAAFGSFSLQNGDKLNVGTILNRYENRVEIAGAVFRPGEFALNESIKTVKQLIEKADGVRGDAFLERAFIRREKENLDAENISFDLGKLLRGEIDDIPLKRQDIITIKSISELREAYTVAIGGAVNNGGSFEYAENMSIGDLIVLAGGFKEGAVSSRIEVARRIKT